MIGLLLMFTYISCIAFISCVPEAVYGTLYESKILMEGFWSVCFPSLKIEVTYGVKSTLTAGFDSVENIISTIHSSALVLYK